MLPQYFPRSLHACERRRQNTNTIFHLFKNNIYNSSTIVNNTLQRLVNPWIATFMHTNWTSERGSAAARKLCRHAGLQVRNKLQRHKTSETSAQVNLQKVKNVYKHVSKCINLSSYVSLSRENVTPPPPGEKTTLSPKWIVGSSAEVMLSKNPYCPWLSDTDLQPQWANWSELEYGRNMEFDYKFLLLHPHSQPNSSLIPSALVSYSWV